VTLFCNNKKTTMKKPLYKNFLFWSVLGLIVFAGIFFVYTRNGQTITSAISSPTSTPQQLVNNKSEGYSFAVPEGWYTEQNASNTIVIYSNYSPEEASSPTCKIEMSVFPYSSSTSVSDWISGRLGVDPTVDVKERSSENILINGATDSIKWNGVMDSLPTTAVYAFSDGHAYEIVPSAIGKTTEGSIAGGQCNDDLNLFLQTLTLD
jgi:hypothetical protein